MEKSTQIPRDYKSIKLPQKARISWGVGKDQLQAPKSLALDDITGNIYVADALNSRIQVFDKQLNYYFHFKGDNNKDVKYPWGVCIRNSLVFVTEKEGNKLKIFTIDGSFITSTTNSGTGYIVKLSSPMGVAVDVDNTTYICDSGSKCIQMLIPELPILRKICIGERPMDVKLHKEYLLVLEEESIQVAFYSKCGDFVRNIKLDMKNSPDFLAIDHFDNLLIACLDTVAKPSIKCGSIVIHSWEGKLIHKINSLFKNIRGLTVDKEGWIINVCEWDESRLKIL